MTIDKTQLSSPSTGAFGAREGAGKYRKGQQKIESILQEAVVLFTESGPSGFSMRALATRMGLKVSAIQYYFPSREDLMCAVSSYFVDRYSTAQTQVVEREYSSDIERLEALLAFMVDVSSEVNRPLQEALVVESRTSTPEMAKDLQRGFAHHLDEISEVLRPLTPQLTDEKRRNRAALIAATTDSLDLYIWQGANLGAQNASLAQDAKAYLRQLALMP